MRALPTSATLLAWLTGVMLLTAACGKSEAPPPVQHAPVQLDEAQSAVVEKFVGTWKHVGGADEQRAADAAVIEATEEMNGLIRGIARGKLEDTVHIDTSITFSVKSGVVTIARSERTQPFAAPADGTRFATTTDAGDDAQASLRIEGNTMITKVETDKGGGERTYAIGADGRLEISARTFSPRLPNDVVFSMHYARP